MQTKHRSILAVVALAATLGTGAAHAGGVSWHIGINLPAPPLVAYAPAPAYYPPPQVVYAPQPVYMAPRPVYAPPQVVYYPPVAVAEREWCPPGREGWRHRHEEREQRWHRGGYHGGDYGGRY